MPLNVVQCFDLQIYFKSISFRFYYKVGQTSLQSGEALIYYKVGQVLLQSGATFLYYKTRLVVLQSGAGITKQDNFYYKVGELLQSRAVQKANNRNVGRQ